MMAAKCFAQIMRKIAGSDNQDIFFPSGASACPTL